MTGPGAAVVWTLTASVIATIVGAATTLVVNRRNDRLKAQLEYVNMQLRRFYGPLLANTEASQRAWAAFRRKYNPAGSTFWDPAHRPSNDDLAAWHHWMTTVFMPLHNRSMTIITKRADLLIGNGMPQCMADLCAHILALRAVLAQWQDDASYIPQVPAYPSRELQSYLEQSFATLKEEQIRLLRATTATIAYPLVRSMPEIAFVSDRWDESSGGESVRD